MLDQNSKFSKPYKVYKDSKQYNELEEQAISFDASELVLDNVTDMTKILEELNDISRKIFIYGTLYDQQNCVVQQLADEFELWQGKMLNSAGLDDKEFKSEKAKERYLIKTYEADYIRFKRTVNDEHYKLQLLKRVVSGLESFGFKLHAIQNAMKAIERTS